MFQWRQVNIPLNNNIRIKISDFGNSTGSSKVLSQTIQTLEYRGLEAILGYDYLPNCDIWSLGCVVFELLTNKYLFNPKTSNFNLFDL